MPYRLILALALSLAIHGVLLQPDLFKRPAAPSNPALQVRLRPRPVVAEAPQPAEPLLKNTLDDAPTTTPDAMRPLATPPRPKPTPTSETKISREVAIAKRKLRKHQFYPPQAIALGLQGDVHLLLTLAADGSIDDVAIAASSGYDLLDNAAIKAAYAIGRLPPTSTRQLLLPVQFRLE